MVALTSDSEMTLEQWGTLPEDAEGELVDGRLVEDEEVGLLHEAVAAWIVGLLRAWLGGRGIIGLSDTRLAPTACRGRKPDVCVYFPGRRAPPHGLVTVPPDIIVEIVSPRPADARRDRVEKLDEYAAFGARFYWIVDPQLRSFEIFELGVDGRYARAVGSIAGRIESVPGCSGLIINVDALWSEIDAAFPEQD
jgi:Uma2 family endonuclease